MSVQDFISDMNALSGQTITVAGRVTCLGHDQCYLYGASNLLTFVLFDPTKLSLDSHKRVSECSLCALVITGQVKSGGGFSLISLIATAVR